MNYKSKPRSKTPNRSKRIEYSKTKERQSDNIETGNSIDYKSKPRNHHGATSRQHYQKIRVNKPHNPFAVRSASQEELEYHRQLSQNSITAVNVVYSDPTFEQQPLDNQYPISQDIYIEPEISNDASLDDLKLSMQAEIEKRINAGLIGIHNPIKLIIYRKYYEYLYKSE